MIKCKGGAVDIRNVIFGTLISEFGCIVKAVYEMFVDDGGASESEAADIIYNAVIVHLGDFENPDESFEAQKKRYDELLKKTAKFDKELFKRDIAEALFDDEDSEDDDADKKQKSEIGFAPKEVIKDALADIIDLIEEIKTEKKN